MTQAPTQRKRRSWGIWTILGIILGAASLASLIQRLFDVGLAPVTADMLEYYRWFMSDVVRHLAFDWWSIRWLGWQFPTWLLDLLAIWILTVAASDRLTALQDKLGVTTTREAGFSGVVSYFRKRFLWRVVLAPVEFVVMARNLIIGVFQMAIAAPALGALRYGFEYRFPRRYTYRWGDVRLAIRLEGRAFWAMFANNLLMLAALTGPLYAAAAFFAWNAVLLTPSS